jgi:hypothetical protein
MSGGSRASCDRGATSTSSAFVLEHDASLGARVKREVRNKLTTGLKNPSRSPGAA